MVEEIWIDVQSDFDNVKLCVRANVSVVRGVFENTELYVPALTF